MRPIYESSTEPKPDSDFLAGELSHLVPGNRGRMLDARRTPVQIVNVRLEVGSFELAIGAFEDAGAHWELSLDAISRFQFAHDAARTSPSALRALEQALSRFEQTVEIPADPEQRAQTLQRIFRVQAQLGELQAPNEVALSEHVRCREGSPQLAAELNAFLLGQGLEEIDLQFTRTYVSNPASGEVVKGHAIVLAELGLCPYRGQAVRDPATFDGAGSRRLRAEHLIARLAFMRAVWERLGRASVVLYRGAAADGPLTPRPTSSFVSATFSEEVAKAHFIGGPSTMSAAFQRRAFPVDRILVTFLETTAMNERFQEAEAILLGDPDGTPF